jgi:hypothetical protein
VRLALVFLLILPLLPMGTPSASAASPFDEYFTSKTMRVDYFHTGKVGQEIVSLDEVVSDGPWAGSRTRLIDESNLGAYLFTVVDPETQRPIYSRGF